MNHLLQFIKARGAGSTRVSVASNFGLPMQQVMGSLGLKPEPAALSPVSPQVAASCIAALLWKDLAYGQELMPLEEAQRYAEWFVAEYGREGASFYVNGQWNEYHGRSSYTGLTSATISAVVMAVHKEFAACVLVEDED